MERESYPRPHKALFRSVRSVSREGAQFLGKSGGRVLSREPRRWCVRDGAEGKERFFPGPQGGFDHVRVPESDRADRRFGLITRVAIFEARRSRANGDALRLLTAVVVGRGVAEVSQVDKRAGAGEGMVTGDAAIRIGLADVRQGLGDVGEFGDDRITHALQTDDDADHEDRRDQHDFSGDDRSDFFRPETPQHRRALFKKVVRETNGPIRRHEAARGLKDKYGAAGGERELPAAP